MNTINSYGGYNLANTLLSGYSQMNDLRLSQALAGKNLGSVNSASKPGATLSNRDSQFLKDYQQKMTDLLDSSNTVLKGGSTDRLAASSENEEVALASGKMPSSNDSFAISVEQLATGQVNRSQSLESAGTLPSMGGAIRIKSEKGSFDFNLSAAGAKTNKEMLQKFATELNSKATGVTAAVKEKDGKSYLELTGATGEASSFSVSGSLSERLGVDQVAEQGQDAVYSVSKNGEAAERMTSKSNTVSLGTGLVATLKGTGSTEIKAGVDSATATADAMEKLVGKFNETLSYLNRNSDRGVGVLQQMKRMILPSTSVKSMEKAGITVQKDGSLKLDRSTLISQLKSNPSTTSNVVDNVARGIKSDAQQGMRTSSASLLGSSQLAQQQTTKIQDPINFMSMYNRSGVYNMLNYYSVGTLMNINI